MRILVVCSGNICRSPMAEGLIRHLLHEDERDRVEVSSAGTLGIIGERAATEAVEVSAEAGFDISEHRSSALDTAAVNGADLVLVMEREHLRAAERLVPGRHRITLLGSYLPAATRALSGEEIDDPLGGGLPAFRTCLRTLERAVAGFLRQWRESEGRPAESEGEDTEQRYFGEIESRILEARGGGPGLTSLEFHVVDGWWKQGVPLWLVLESLSEAASAWSPGEAPRRFIRKVEVEVTERIASAGLQGEAGTEAGKTSGTPVNPDDQRRSRAAEVLRRAWERQGGAHPGISTAIEALLSELRDRPSTTADTSETLARGHQLLCEAASNCLPLGASETIREEEAARLAGLGSRLSPQARDETLRRLVDGRILRWFDLPNLQSFDPEEF